MITKGIVKELNRQGGNTFRVYIPLLRTAADGEGDAIFPATLCCIGGMNGSLKVGDVVFVGFEDNYYDKPVILGKLFLGEDGEGDSLNATFNSIRVVGKAVLPDDTHVGNRDLSKALKDVVDLLGDRKKGEL